MAELVDVVVVGGGIGGSSCGLVLARAGLSVCVLEPTTEFPDLVRGEWMAPWGVAHAQATGVYDVLVAAGGRHIGSHVSFDEGLSPEEARARGVGFEGMLPGIPGPLAVRHPVSCQALAEAAAGAGAEVLRGVTDIDLDSLVAGRTVSFTTAEGVRREVQGRIVLGADGRSSAVRKAIGVQLARFETGHHLAGLLVDGLEFLGDDTVEYIATEGGVHSLCFPQGGGRARLYLSYAETDAARYGGADRAQKYLDAFVMDCFPGSEGFRTATPISPANGYRSVDTWCDRPFVEGVVLLGDAAGHNDPIIGQGLSITAADVRGVTEVLLGSDDWSAAAFEPYAAERYERLRRLRWAAQVYALANAGMSWARDTDRRMALKERPEVFLSSAATIVGPHFAPAEIFADEAMAALVSGAA